MRILHTSDWHLGRIFYGTYLTDDQAYILDQFINLVKDEKPDVILISGDIFDRSVPPVEAVNLLDDVMSRILMDYSVPIITIAGNHDSPDRLGFGYRLLQGKGLNISGRLNIDMMSTIIEDKYGPVHFYSIPYVEPAVVREKLLDDTIHSHDASMGRLINHIKDRMDKNSRNVLLAHAFAAGCEECESERPLSVGGSSMVSSSYFEGFNYTALGHLHRPQKVGAQNIRYSGSLMKYSFAEAIHKKCVYMIDMDEKGDIKVQEIELKPKRDVRCIEGYLEEIIKGPKSGESKEDYMLVKVKDTEPIFNIMEKVRAVYPNALSIDRPQLTLGGNLSGLDKDYKKLSEFDLYSSFFKQVTDLEISMDQGHLFEKALEKFYKEEREA